MRSILFEIPFIHITVKSYGTMMVVGFLAALFVMRRLVRTIKGDGEHLANAAVYALIAGVLGARVFYVAHHFSEYKNDLLSVFAVWQGGLEFLGGVILAIGVLLFYLWYYKLPTLKYLDILAIGLMIGLGFGRVGCLLNGCCFGKPTGSPIGIRFPYDSNPYHSQIRPHYDRNRDKPHLDLPAEYFYHLSTDDKTMYPADENTKYQAFLKPYEDLTEDQKIQVKRGQYRCLKVHPTQLYSSAYAFALAGFCYLLWRKYSALRPGLVLGLMLIFYGVSRFTVEFLRDDNPFEYDWWAICKGYTVSQNIAVYLVILGIILSLYCVTGKRSKA